MDDSQKEAEWREWVETHAPKLLLFARQKTCSEADAQDLVQEAVLECCGRCRDGEPPPLGLVFRTIQRRAIDLARREQRRANRERVSEGPGEAWFDSSIEEREMKELIQSALARLPQEFREVLVLKVWAGLTFAEIADTLSIPANTAASRYRYGLVELRKLCKGVLT